MKKCFKTLLVTGVLSLLATTTVFAKTTIVGEEKSGKEYETETIADFTEQIGSRESLTGDIIIHLIAKGEKLRFDNIVDGVPNTYVMARCYTCREYDNWWHDWFEDINFGEYVKGKEYDVYKIAKNEIDKYTNISEEERQEELNTAIWVVFVNSYNSEDDYDYTMSTVEPFFFRFVDVPLLEQDSEEEPEENPTASDSNTSRPSGGSSGSSSSSSRKGNSNNTNNSIAGNWKQDSQGWWFEKLGGGYAKNEWIQKDGIWYHFDESGYMQTGWIDINGIKYFLNPNGAMVSNNWSLQGGKWYFFDTTGAMKKGWQEWKGKWYYLDNGTGEMLYNVTTPDNYQLDENGAMINS